MTAISKPMLARQPKEIKEFKKKEQIDTGSFLIGAAAGLYLSLADSSYRTAAIAIPAIAGCALTANRCRQTAPKNQFYSWCRLELKSLIVGAGLGFATVVIPYHCLSLIWMNYVDIQRAILEKAVEEGNFEKVKQTLWVDSNVELALLKAVKKNYPNIVKFILQEKDVDSKLITRLLNTAIEARNLEMIKIIMESKSALTAEAEDLGESIDLAVPRYHDLNAHKIILETRKDAKVRGGLLAFIKDPDLITLILQNKNNQFSLIDVQNALNEYAKTCQVESIRNILQAYLSLDKKALTLALGQANQNNCLEVIKILLERKDIDPEAVGWTLRQASFLGHQKIVESIFHSAISIDPRYLRVGFSYACDKGNLEIIRLYVPRIDQIGGDSKIHALKNTIERGHREAAYFLIKTFKSIDLEDKTNVMKIAEKMNDLEILNAISAIPLKMPFRWF